MNLLNFSKNYSWKKYKKQFNKQFKFQDEEHELRAELRHKRLRHWLIPLLILIFIVLIYLFHSKIANLFVGMNISLQHADFILNLIQAIAAVLGIILIFSPPRLKKVKEIKKRVKNYQPHLPKHYVDIDCQPSNPSDETKKDPYRRSLREQTWEFIFSYQKDKRRYLQILGDFGVGKTTFCYYIAHEIICSMLSVDVIIIQLGIQGLDLEYELKKIKEEDRERTIIILDSYDEYKKRGHTQVEFSTLESLTIGFFKIIITSRTNYFTHEEAEPKFDTTYISYFSKDQIRHFLKMHHPFIWRRYWGMLQRYEELADLTQRAIILNYLNDFKVLKKIEEDEKLEGRLNEYSIYGKIIDNIIEHSQLTERNPNELMTPRQIIEVMSLLGFYVICCGGNNRIHYSYLGETLTDLIDKFNLSTSEIADFFKDRELLEVNSRIISEVRTRTFLIRDDQGSYRFAHQSFAEYFAARFIIESILEKEVIKDITPSLMPPRVKTFLFEADLPDEQYIKLISMIPPLYRSVSTKLSMDDAKKMIRENDFYDSSWFPEGKGLIHGYKSFQIKNDKIVCDFSTGLMWQQDGSDKYMTLDQTEKYINTLNSEKFAGFNDWRLPTLEEAMSLIEPEKKNKDLYIDPMFDETQRWIWTSDEVKGERRRWVVGFYGGGCYGVSFYYDGDYVRAVRSRQSSG